MIITVAKENGEHLASDVICYDSYQDEREAYNNNCALLKLLHDSIINKKSADESSVYRKTTDYAIHRTITTNGRTTFERECVIAIVPDTGLLKKEWVYEDREIQNGQGGTTHLKGWHLE